MALLPFALTLPALHLAIHTLSVSSLTVVQYMLATHETAGSTVLLGAAHSNLEKWLFKSCYVWVVCNFLLWSHLSGKKAMVAAGTKVTPAVCDCEAGRKHGPSARCQTLFKISDPAVANSCTVLSAPQNRYPRCHLMKSKGWFSVAGFYWIVPTTPYPCSTPEQLYGRVILHPKKLRISIKTCLHLWWSVLKLHIVTEDRFWMSSLLRQ